MHFVLTKNNSSKFFSGSAYIFEVGLYTFTQIFPIRNLKNSWGGGGESSEKRVGEISEKRVG